MSRRRQALLLPGRNYSVQGPLLMYTHVALQSRGAHTYPIAWKDVDRIAADEHGMVEGVCEQTEAVLDRVHNDDPPLLVGKSLGSAAAILAAHHGLPAIWFTPLLQHYPIVQALRRATAPFLLIGGSADPAWNQTLAKDLPGEFREIRGADHGMFIRGRPLIDSAHALADVIEAVEAFIDTAVWPRQG
ncbi:alpha/beta hydrolase [Glycomyces sp. A-F 0318]|uniref:alpha/beta hydrolase n=1 Tax=Glycomyces amatae TaxID=2881355 RepID=UPI001E376016|nr:alpha/beta hydrolase [Glycomyces amatae]MCD0447013.1 alpha/beta hydrolase [Glycomyces amatae]